MRIVQYSIADIVYKKIKKQILTRKLRLGQRITDVDFAEAFQVSKTPVREAFLRLKSEGLLEIYPRSGTFVFKFSEDDIFALCQARIVIEQGALRGANYHNNVRLIGGLQKNIDNGHALIEQEHLSGYLDNDKDFHNTIFLLSNNPYLEKYNTMIFDKITVLRSYLPLTQDFISNSITAHNTILEYIISDDIEKACERIKFHIENAFNKHFLEYLDKVSASPERT